MILEDFIMLGSTVPQPNSDGRVFVCSAGISPELGKLVRLYPLARRNIPHRWDVHRVPVERNPSDSRPESWKVAGDRSPGAHERINEHFAKTGTVSPGKRVGLLRDHVVGSIKQANAQHRSLAIIHPDAIELDFDLNRESPESNLMPLFDLPDGPAPQGAKWFPWQPRLRFKDELGWNNLMLRDWGTYELQRKRGGDYFRRNLAGALHLDENSSLLVGNINRHRNAWLVISVLNGVREAATLFDALADERPRITDKMRQAVYARDGYACTGCGSRDELTVDHVMPYSKGGSTTLANLRTLCKGCNLAKSDAALCRGSVLTIHFTVTRR